MNNNHAYAVQVVGRAMHPRLMAGEHASVDPSLPMKDGDDVLVVTKGPDAVAMFGLLRHRRGGEVRLDWLRGEGITLDEAELERVHLVAGVSRNQPRTLPP